MSEVDDIALLFYPCFFVHHPYRTIHESLISPWRRVVWADFPAFYIRNGWVPTHLFLSLFRAPFPNPVITSYSIHYTKLYEILSSLVRTLIWTSLHHSKNRSR